MILCISAGELNHLPALFTCHLCDGANAARLIDKPICGSTLPMQPATLSTAWLILVSLGICGGYLPCGFMTEVRTDDALDS